MKAGDTNLADLIVKSSSTSQSIEERIERRLQVLHSWLLDGIPAGKFTPKSLTAARVWEDVELNIMRISSPNEFTTTHPEHGESVRDIGDLLTKLKKRFERPSTSVGKRSKIVTEKFDRKAFDRQREAAVSQWHSERDKHLQQKRRADSSEARSDLLLEENARKDEQIADLQRRLSEHEGLRTVK